MRSLCAQQKAAPSLCKQRKPLHSSEDSAQPKMKCKEVLCPSNTIQMQR